MSVKNDLLRKYNDLVSKKPLGINFSDIDPCRLYSEFMEKELIPNSYERFGQIFRELEGLKQFNVNNYNKNIDNLIPFRNAIFYNELIQIQVFFEFISNIESLYKNCTNLQIIFKIKNDLRMNKIRNAIAHFDWHFINGKVQFKDNNYLIEYDYYEISEFCSLISMLAIFMTNNIEIL